MDKKKLINIIYILFFLIGAGIFLYPKLSDLLNKMQQKNVITQYYKSVEDAVDYEGEWEKAVSYNAKLAASQSILSLIESTQEQDIEYDNLLNISGTGVMGIVEIPKINVRLPIYHGTDETVLKSGAGHIKGTSLPTGGEGTHCVISGHRGLPSAELFTHLDKITIGDRFHMHVLNHDMEYQVDQILVVEPTEADAIYIENGKDPLFGKDEDSHYEGYFGFSTNDEEGLLGENIKHNWLLGMHYEIDFVLGDYIGPMDYYFRGDDNFWLYIDGELVKDVDLGGVHSSAGAYVDLREWMDERGMLDDQKKKHTMSVYFSERGGAGSCCYMSFTIPSNNEILNGKTSYSVKKNLG